jgi:uncharacterized protein
MKERAKEMDASTDVSQWQKLDEGVIPLWRVQSCIVLTFIFGVLLSIATALWLLTPFPGLILLALVLLAISLFYLNLFWLPLRSYQAWFYRLSDDIVELKSGVIINTSVLIPLSRLQHVDLIRGPIEQRFGLSSLKIHTAGTRAASHTIPGLEASIAIKLRDDLVKAAKLKVN